MVSLDGRSRWTALAALNAAKAWTIEPAAGASPNDQQIDVTDAARLRKARGLAPASRAREPIRPVGRAATAARAGERSG